jgi:hypothetical protein
MYGRRQNSALYVGAATLAGAFLGNHHAQRDIERDWRLSPYTPMLHPLYQGRYRQLRTVQYGAMAGLAMLIATAVARRAGRRSP